MTICLICDFYSKPAIKLDGFTSVFYASMLEATAQYFEAAQSLYLPNFSFCLIGLYWVVCYYQFVLITSQNVTASQNTALAKKAPSGAPRRRHLQSREPFGALFVLLCCVIRASLSFLMGGADRIFQDSVCTITVRDGPWGPLRALGFRQ